MAAARFDTVVAIATPPGESGVAIVRVSGPDAIPIAATLSPALCNLADEPTHTVRHAWLRDADGEPLDEALVTVMRAPRTFTAEDVVEIGVHGGTMPARRVLRALLAAGARLAERGEFTKRAFVHGRIDLSRAEAVIDVIRARTDRGAVSALAGLAGGVAARTEAVESRLLDLQARLELNLDFNEDVSAVSLEEIGQTLHAGREQLEELCRRAPWGRRLREGASVVLVGRPNVGKSSLFNAMLEDDRALVSAEPGTTRDYLEAWIDVAGIPVRLVDTAGQHEGGGEIEREGVVRSRAREAEADLRILVVDGPEAPTAEDEEILTRSANRSRIVVANKADLGDIHPAWAKETDVRVSARTGGGVEDLRARLTDALLTDLGREPEDGVLPNERHVEALRRAAEALDRALATQEAGGTEELIASDVRDATAALGEITGKSVDDEVLDRVFSGFCIGK